MKRRSPLGLAKFCSVIPCRSAARMLSRRGAKAPFRVAAAGAAEIMRCWARYLHSFLICHLDIASISFPRQVHAFRPLFGSTAPPLEIQALEPFAQQILGDSCITNRLFEEEREINVCCGPPLLKTCTPPCTPRLYQLWCLWHPPGALAMKKIILEAHSALNEPRSSVGT